MKILILDHFNRHGGAQEYAIDLARKFNDMGHHCYLPEIEHETLKELAQDIPKTSFSLAMNGVTGVFRLFVLLLRVINEIKQKKIEVIHCNSVPSLIFAKLLMLKNPIVYTAHDCNLPRFKRFIIQHCSKHIVSVSKTVKENLKSLNVSKPNDVIFNGLFDFSIKQAHKQRTNTIFGVAGRIERTKGIDIFIDAALIVLNNYSGVEFHIIGFSEDAEYLKELKSKITGVDRIVFRKFCTSKTELYSSIDVLVNCSRYCEPLGRTLIEAGIVSIPVIGPDRCGPAEIIEHGVSGLLFDSGDSNSLANAFETILSDVEYRKKLGSGGRSVYEKKFRIENIAQQLISLYKDEIKEM